MRIPTVKDFQENLIKIYGTACSSYFISICQMDKNYTDVVIPWLECIFDQLEKENLITEQFEKVWDAVCIDFILAPASSNSKFHGAYPGGLILHSIEVLRLCLYQARAYKTFTPITTKSVDIDKEDLAFCAFFHDIGKAGNRNEIFYSFKDSDWHRKKLQQYYDINSKALTLNHAVMSTMYLASITTLSVKQLQCIQYHDGQYIQDNKSVQHKDCAELCILSQVDYWCAHIYNV